MKKRNVARSVSHVHVFEYIYDRIRFAFKYFGMPRTKAGPVFSENDPGLLIGQAENSGKEQTDGSPDGDTGSPGDDNEDPEAGSPTETRANNAAETSKPEPVTNCLGSTLPKAQQCSSNKVCSERKNNLGNSGKLKLDITTAMQASRTNDAAQNC